MKILKSALLIVSIQYFFAFILSIIDTFTVKEPIVIKFIIHNPLIRFIFLTHGYFLYFLLGLVILGILYLLSRIKFLKFLFNNRFTSNLISMNIALIIVLFILIPLDRTLPPQKFLPGKLLIIIFGLILFFLYIILARAIEFVSARENAHFKRILTGIFTYLMIFLLLSSIGLRVIYHIPPPGKGDGEALNVIFISIDTLRSDHLPIFGYENCKTPALDNFSKRCIVFENCIASSPHTVPSMASIITGNYPIIHNCRFVPLKPINKDVPLLSEILHDLGYHTEFYTANPIVDPPRGFTRGFDCYESWYFTGDLRYYFPKRIYRIIHSILLFAKIKNKVKYYDTTEWLMEKAISRLSTMKHYTPFFLWFHFLDPHGAYTPPPDFIPAKGEERERLDSMKLGLEDDDYPIKYKDEIIKLYDGEIQYVDFALGSVLQEIEDEGFLENTIIVLTADHGEEFWEHGKFGHGHCLYPEVVRIPLLIYLPPAIGEWTGVVSEYVSHIDIAPTILDYLGVPPDENMEGRSLHTLIESTTERTGEDQKDFTTYPVFNDVAKYPCQFNIKDSIYKDGFHLIYDFNDKVVEVYDLNNDINELNNLYGEGKYDELFNELVNWYELNTVRSKKLTPNIEIEMTEEEIELLRGLGYIID